MNGEILRGMAMVGYRIRAVAPIAKASIEDPDAWLEQNSNARIFRYVVPFSATTPDVATSSPYETTERIEVSRIASAIIDRKRPDLLVVGRDNYIPFLATIDSTRTLPTVFISHADPEYWLSHAGAGWRREYLEGLRRVQVIVAVSQNQRKSWQQLGFDNIEVIPNTVDASKFRPGAKDSRLMKSLDILPSQITIAHASNLKPAKRFMDIVASAEHALRRRADLVYLVIGDGQGRPLMERECRQKNIRKRFRFTGWISHQHIPDYLRLSDLVVMPSERESSPLAHMEAMACAKTLIASDIPASRELLEDGRSGLLFPTGDVAALTAKTLLAASNAELRTTIARAALQRSKRRSFDAMIARYSAVCSQLIS